MRLKRLADFTIALVLLVIASPLLLVISLLVRIDSPGAILFKQERLGKDGRIFTVYKFRTMIENAGDGEVVDGQHDPRITRVGSFLRSWSLDELPQLVNILRGEMSVVGPRPDRTFRLDSYTERQRQRLRMRPGITGLAQINGRNQIPWEERYEFDVEYVNNWSLGLDLLILVKTIRVVLSREGVNFS